MNRGLLSLLSTSVTVFQYVCKTITLPHFRDTYTTLNSQLFERFSVCLGQWPQIAFYISYGYIYQENLPPKIFDHGEIIEFCKKVDLKGDSLCRAAIVVSRLCGGPKEVDLFNKICLKGNIHVGFIFAHLLKILTSKTKFNKLPAASGKQK